MTLSLVNSNYVYAGNVCRPAQFSVSEYQKPDILYFNRASFSSSFSTFQLQFNSLNFFRCNRNISSVDSRIIGREE